MRTTFRRLKSFTPGKDVWRKLCENLNPEMDMGKEVSILEILESNGVEDAFWALRTQEYRDYCLILADVAESVLDVFEEKYPDDKRPRKAVEAIRLWNAGKITDGELKAAADSAYAAHAYAAAYAARAYAYADAYAVTAAAAAYSAAYAYADADAVTAAAAAAYSAAYSADAEASAWERQWEKNEKILRKYLEVKK